ncbi:MAG: hypothetical protein IPL48_13660 [Bacteroidetes bacterium]|nr:hypothetical protein [Bacteroidota bacterium]
MQYIQGTDRIHCVILARNLDANFSTVNEVRHIDLFAESICKINNFKKENYFFLYSNYSY